MSIVTNVLQRSKCALFQVDSAPVAIGRVARELFASASWAVDGWPVKSSIHGSVFEIDRAHGLDQFQVRISVFVPKQAPQTCASKFEPVDPACHFLVG